MNKSVYREMDECLYVQIVLNVFFTVDTLSTILCAVDDIGFSIDVLMQNVRKIGDGRTVTVPRNGMTNMRNVGGELRPV